MQRRRNIKRDKMHGRLYTVSGGAPNQPLVCVVADAFWSRSDADGWTGWLETQIVLFRSAWFAAKDHASLAEWIEQDREEWRSFGSGARKTIPVSVFIDVSQSPASADLMDRLRDDQTQVEACKLTAGDDSALIDRRLAQSATVAVGARWLISFFDGRIAKTQATEQRHGRPFVSGRVIASFAEFEDGEPPLMGQDEVRASMSAAEGLVKRGAKNTYTEALISLNADEVVACCVMLTLLAAETLSPVVEYSESRVTPYRPLSDRERDAAKSFGPLV